MENLGCVTFRETALLLDDERVIHESTPIQPIAQDGYRDTLVITLRRDGFQTAMEGARVVCLVKRGDRTVVYAIGDDGRAREITVEPGAQLGAGRGGPATPCAAKQVV